jgi:hypothetical protein
MENFIHVAVGGSDGLLQTAAILARADVDHIPVPPVMLGVGLFQIL